MLEFKTFNKEKVVFYFSSAYFVIHEWTTLNYYFLDKNTMIFRKHDGALSTLGNFNTFCGIGNFAEIGDTFYLEEDLPSYYV